MEDFIIINGQKVSRFDLLGAYILEDPERLIFEPGDTIIIKTIDGWLGTKYDELDQHTEDLLDDLINPM
jgi:hypothetical protein